jgi:hypothetical protein
MKTKVSCPCREPNPGRPVRSPSLHRLSYLLTYLQSWALLEKPPIVQLLKNFPVFYGTRKFITVFTRVLQWPLSWTRLIQSIPPYPISLRAILILSTHLRLGLPSGLFPSGFPQISYMHSSAPQFMLHALPISSSLTWSWRQDTMDNKCSRSSDLRHQQQLQ